MLRVNPGHQEARRNHGQMRVVFFGLGVNYEVAVMRLFGLQVIGMQVVQYDYPRSYEHLPPREVGMAVMKNTPTCGRTDDCDWGSVSVSVSVGIVLPVWAFVRPEVALTASSNWAVCWCCLREGYWQELGVRKSQDLLTCSLGHPCCWSDR